ncbi:hypothetical protein [Vulcanisaeta sp. JCM 16159]|uniref:hypothetical protein n=1 Tax=Vulcanisaeta sp. JCM 16159 TaxID=1295371 RepID=UPI000AD7F2C8|nr:hypothetical protein [Vulcanisaeta sp. JCM 16159]
MQIRSALTFILGIMLVALLMYETLTLHPSNGHKMAQKDSSLNGDPIIYISSPMVKASGFVSFAAGNYDGIPVVVYKAGGLYMPSGRL